VIFKNNLFQSGLYFEEKVCPKEGGKVGDRMKGGKGKREGNRCGG